ncbi:metal-sensitive transcriptional regulator [Candidatus Shapirobacteria bacterium]|nr:metal-sensitive transcriptional regulator [Candidatus Shapirobacteria bacterium]HQI13232.1 metal-sensitive transcriptional regulator [Candidatus Woesebacteria bacterium]
MKSIEQRINIIIGQLEGVKKMADRQDDCLKVLTQLKAIRSAVSGLIQTVVADKFDTCLSSLKKDDKKLLINLKKYVTTN